MTMRSALAMRAPRARQSMPQRDMSELAGLLPRQQLRRFIMPVSLGLILSLLVLLPIFFMFLGALRAGVAVSPLAPSSTPEQLRLMIDDCAALLLCPGLPGMGGADRSAAPRAGGKRNRKPTRVTRRRCARR